MNYRNVLLFVVALIICVPALAFAGKPTKPTYVTQEDFDKGVDDLQEQIDTIELTPGDKGDKGDQGIQGVAGNDGAKGDKG